MNVVNPCADPWKPVDLKKYTLAFCLVESEFPFEF